jgi:hypothetical protein
MGILSAEIDVALPWPELRWWILGGVLAILVAGSCAIVWVVRRIARSAESGSHPGHR